ncbi:DOPA 4,5-dioxygenase family protein [Crocosphaera sp. Alani8]|uniref:DOPA 4,5-dioxygenase family protein n=1 Tax=Crocosphaera sp. Alani8 TaxID=3038952 RepID=UPI00313D6450
MINTSFNSRDSLTNITGFHAHVYYNQESKSQADLLRESLNNTFEERIRLGRWHDNPIGPHPIGSYQLAFSPEQFGLVVPWLMVHHGQLSILVHPETGNDLIDHRNYSLWIGEQLELNLKVFQK